MKAHKEILTELARAEREELKQWEDLALHTLNCGACMGRGKGVARVHLLWLIRQMHKIMGWTG